MIAIREILSTMDYGPSPEARDHVSAWLAKHEAGFGQFIAGRFGEPGALFDVFNPATGERIAGATRGATADVDAAVKAARRRSGRGARSPATSGRAISTRLRVTCRNASAFSPCWRSIDNGKPIRESRDIDVPLVARHFYHHAGWASLVDERIPRLAAGRRMRPDRSMELSAVDARLEDRAGAGRREHGRAQAGLEYTPLTALAFAEICVEAGLPAGRRQHHHWRRRDGLGARRARGRRQGRLHRLDRGREDDPQGDGRQRQEAVARTRRQVAVHRLRRRRSRQRDRGGGRRHLVQPGSGLLRRLAAADVGGNRQELHRQAEGAHGQAEGRRSPRQVDRRGRDRLARPAREHPEPRRRGREGGC